jgi:serine/threonine-protein kinase PknG
VTTTPCMEPGCSGTVLDDGYCDTCGTKAKPAAAPEGAAAPDPRAARRARRAAKAAATATATNAPAAAAPAPGSSCLEPGCGGTILADGYCDTCGTKAVAQAAPPVGVAPAAGGEEAAPSRASRPSRIGRTLVTGSAKAQGSRRTASARTRSTSQRFAIGAGLVDVPPAPVIDPSTVVLADPVVAEEKRFCSKCGAAVGRSKGGRPGREKGFCGACRQPYDFVPKLSAGTLIGGQYEILGCLAHGGLGWIYLGRDKAVNDRWIVLKGLLDSGDEAASVAAVAEKRFLAEVQHPNIVEIYNFVTHRGAGYIVMEYVGGPSLKQILKKRRADNGDVPLPLPVDQAIAFVLAVLPAFAYLHDRRLVYCDFKPDNMIQVVDQVKLIDLGGVRRADDPSGDVYGTVGFQAPEIAEIGPSIASDVYTIGRTLAVLTLDFRGYQSTFQHSLPDPEQHPALVEYESFHRLLLKATAPHPDDRFQSVGELSDQLLGVLREVVALQHGRPQPGASAVFSGAVDQGLPALALDASDTASAFLANVLALPASERLAAIDDALASAQVEETPEVRLRRAAALIELGRADEAGAVLDAVEANDPWEWRAVWLRGVAALAEPDPAAAAAAFERCLAEVPGELAPKLASAMAAEEAGDLETAAALYDVVSSVDPAYVAAAEGLARCELAAGDVAAAIAAYDRVPRTHRAYEGSRLDAATALAGAGRHAEAAAQLDGLTLSDVEREQVMLSIYEDALGRLLAKTLTADPNVKLGGHPLTETGMRRAVESASRRLADLTPDHACRSSDGRSSDLPIVWCGRIGR